MSRIFFFTGLILLLASGPVWGSPDTCVCAGGKPLTGDTLVFTGKVLDVTTNNVASGTKATVGVDRVYSGEVEPVTVVSTPYSGKECGFPFEKDSVYLIVAIKGRSIKTTTCLPTRFMGDVSDVEARWGEGKPPGKNLDKVYSGILWMSLLTLGGFALLAGILLWRRRKA